MITAVFLYIELIKMTKVVLATGNAGKVKEMADLLKDFGLDVIAQTQLNVSDVEETGLTFIENAIIKARHASKETGLPAISDDSGLEVDFLKGEPGIYSARYAGGKSDQANIDKLLEKMQQAPENARSARFHCVLVYLRHETDPTPIVCHGTFEGQITLKQAGTNGFGYDPVFWVEEHKCTAAQLEPQLKKQISHRAKALKQLFSALTQTQLKAN